MSAPAPYNITICQGASYNLEVTYTDENNAPIDLTGSTLRGQIRKSISDDTIQATFTITITDAVNGVFTVSLTPAQTEAIEIKAQKDTVRELEAFAYDIERELVGGEVDRIMQGEAFVSPQVTR